MTDGKQDSRWDFQYPKEAVGAVQQMLGSMCVCSNPPFMDMADPMAALSFFGQYPRMHAAPASSGCLLGMQYREPSIYLPE